jgi:FdrA protein
MKYESSMGLSYAFLNYYVFNLKYLRMSKWILENILRSQVLFYVQVRQNFYRDSLQLLKISDKIKRQLGIHEAAVIMGTRTNKQILSKLGFPQDKIKQAKESDSIIAIKAQDKKSLDSVLTRLDDLLEGTDRIMSGTENTGQTLDLNSALISMHDANLALISVPGEYVKDLSLRLIDAGIHQQIFSDHVPISDELVIKKHASDNGILILGPGSGTSIINGKGVGFSNIIRNGPVGIVAAAGTGLQEVSTLLDRSEIGVKHGLGVGGNDPKDEIGGIMIIESIKALEACNDIRIIDIVSKPPSSQVKEKITEYILSNGKKNYVLTFIGTAKMTNYHVKARKVLEVNTLTSSVLAVAKQSGVDNFRKTIEEIYIPSMTLSKRLEKEWLELHKSQKYLRALLTGGTFTYEAQVILNGIPLRDIYSNVPIVGSRVLPNTSKSYMNSVIDLGEEEFTEGRAHPMIDPTIRKLRLLDESMDSKVAVIMLDFVLGYGSNSDPVGAIINEIRNAKTNAERQGRYLSIVAYVCGTKRDPQNYESSMQLLKRSGVIVMPTNAFATIASATIASRGRIDLEQIYAKYIDLGGIID